MINIKSYTLKNDILVKAKYKNTNFYEYLSIMYHLVDNAKKENINIKDLVAKVINKTK